MVLGAPFSKLPHLSKMVVITKNRNVLKIAILYFNGRYMGMSCIYSSFSASFVNF
jgi:hypothetical protein